MIDTKYIPMIMTFDRDKASIIVDLLEEQIEYDYNYLSFFVFDEKE